MNSTINSTPSPLRPLHHSSSINSMTSPLKKPSMEALAYHHHHHHQQQQQQTMIMMNAMAPPPSYHMLQQQPQPSQQRMVYSPSKFGPSPPTSPQLLPSPASISNVMMSPRMTSSYPSPPLAISYANRPTSPTESVSSVTSSASTSSGSALSKYYQSRGWKCTSAPTAPVVGASNSAPSAAPAGPSSIPASTAGGDAHIRYDHVIRSLRPALPSYRASQVAHAPQPSEQPLPKLPAKRSLLDLKLPALPESEPMRLTRRTSCFAITQVTGCDAETFALCADFDSLLED